MKIFALPYLEFPQTEPVYDGIADSSLTPWRKPFYLPEFDSRFTMNVVPAVVLSRLGKTISQRFADRYYREGMIGIFFKAADMYERLSKQGLPASLATSFDSSLMVSPRMDFSQLEDIYQHGVDVKINGETRTTVMCGDLREQTNRAIHQLSQSVTLKTGDVLCLSVPPVGIDIREGDEITLVAKGTGETLHQFIIK